MRRSIELTPRLRMIADLVPAGSRLIDVGTDHGYLPAALLLERRIISAIATDIRSGPLSRAKSTAETWKLSEKMTFRLQDGLLGLGPEDADAVVIAGMGGETIAKILKMAPWTREGNIPLILQPMSTIDRLRDWLCKNGYIIVDERLAREGENLYTALLVHAGKAQMLTMAEILAGENRPDPLRGIWLDRLIKKTERTIEGLTLSKLEQAASRRLEQEDILYGLKIMKKEWKTWQ